MTGERAELTLPSSFSLLDEPWIAARMTDGAAAELSIRETFARAHEIRELTGELPTQSFAILRLLLAILYRAGYDRHPLDEWREWRASGLPLDDLNAYLEEFADRFDLLHPQRPFFQVADLTTAKGERKDVTPLILDLPSNSRLFTNRAGEGATRLSFAEAARWLVNAQAFDFSGIKSGALGDDRVKGGKGYPIGVAWTGLLGGVYAQGTTLRDTLLLNLVAPGSGLTYDPERDLPPWEDESPDTAAGRPGLVPAGPVRLYTWQSRRIRLFTGTGTADSGVVVGCLVANGDRLTPQNLFAHEPMTAWRYSDPQTKTWKQTTYMPREHQPGRALWRGIGALLPGLDQLVPKRGVKSSLPPGIVDWLSTLLENHDLDATERVRLRSASVVYGSNNSVVDEVLSDEILLPLALLREQNGPLAHQAELAVQLADEGVRALRDLAANLQRAAGGDGEGARTAVSDLAYAELDGPYRHWLESLGGVAVDPLDAIDRWKTTAYGILSTLGAQMVAQAPPAAWAGREVSRNGRVDLITTPRAEGWYRRALHKTFGTTPRKDAAA